MKSTKFLRSARWAVVILLFSISLPVSAQIGPIIWQDNFNSLNTAIWNPNVGDGCNVGLCGWGNAELQSYSANNVSIEPVPGESGNNALVLEARRENAGGSSFTSGKVDTESNLSIQYGLIEIRMRTPDVDMGLWPAAWLLGTSNLNWPAKGEIDMMEMGNNAAGRANQGYPNSDINRYVGANAIFANSDGSVGSIAYDANYNQPYYANTSLADRFVTYRLYWEPTQMRYTVIDNGTEYDLYANPLPLDPNGVTGAFTKPFYLLLNLAVGGNFTDAAVPSQVNAPLPAKLYIDYVRVYEWNGHGSVETDYGALTAENGTFGVYTESTPTDNDLTFGTDGELFVWGGTFQNGTTAPFEGSDVIAWETTTANSWFGGGITASYGKNMSNFVTDGSLKFRIKIPGNVAFRIGITDNFTNESWITFPAGQNQYGLTRDGNWGEAEIPLADFAGLIAFQDIGYLFAIASVDGALPTSTFELGIDDIVWDDGTGNGGGNDPGTGLTGTYFNEMNFTNQALTRVDPTIDFTWGQGSPDPSLDANTFSIRWSGEVLPVSSGTYTFYTRTDDGVRLWVDGQQIVNQWVNQGPTEWSGTVSLTDGQAVPIVMEYYENGGGAVAQLSWSGPGVSKQIVPQANLYPAAGPGNFSLRIEAEDYTAMSGIQTEATTDDGGGLNVGWIDAGDWMDYEVNIPSAGTYNVDFRVASVPGNAAVQFQVGGTVLGTANIFTTQGWQNWSTVSTTVNLAAGPQTVRLYSPGDNFNINWFEIQSTAAKAAATPELAAPAPQWILYPNPAQDQLFVRFPAPDLCQQLEIVDLTGKVLLRMAPSGHATTALDVQALPAGMYALRVHLRDGSVDTARFMK